MEPRMHCKLLSACYVCCGVEHLRYVSGAHGHGCVHCMPMVLTQQFSTVVTVRMETRGLSKIGSTLDA